MQVRIRHGRAIDPHPLPLHHMVGKPNPAVTCVPPHARERARKPHRPSEGMQPRNHAAIGHQRACYANRAACSSMVLGPSAHATWRAHATGTGRGASRSPNPSGSRLSTRERARTADQQASPAGYSRGFEPPRGYRGPSPKIRTASWPRATCPHTHEREGP